MCCLSVEINIFARSDVNLVKHLFFFYLSSSELRMQCGIVRASYDVLVSDSGIVSRRSGLSPTCANNNMLSLIRL